MKLYKNIWKRIGAMVIAVSMALSFGINMMAVDVNASEDDELTSTQRNSINMLNYMTVLTQKVNASKGNQMVLESEYSSLVNDIYPNAVDDTTQTQITDLMDTINEYRMISVKRERLQFIYDQNRASAMRQAIPNPVGLLSVVQSGNMLKAAVSVLYMTADSVSSYKTAASQADLEFIKDGWELDDAESEALHNSTKKQLSYMLSMVRDYDLPGDYALNKESVEDFVSWSSKPESSLVSKIEWLESHDDTYREFGPYWLELAKDYFNSGNYKKCLKSIKKYETVSTRIFRKDIDYAMALPMAIVSAKETMKPSEYRKTADKYCATILSNTKDSDWSVRYFVAQIYMDLYAISKDKKYINEAYDIAVDNVNVLVSSQKDFNDAYLKDLEKVEPGKNATKREKKEIKAYNKQAKEERKIAMPPVNEALYLNCDMLFGLAEEKKIKDSQKKKIDAILHEDGNSLFLTKVLDDRFWFEKNEKKLDTSKIDIEFDGDSMVVPGTCVSDRTVIKVAVNGSKGKTWINDWAVTDVDRPKEFKDCSEFVAAFKSKTGKDYDYKEGETVTVYVITVKDSPKKYVDFKYKVVAEKKAFVFNGVGFERITK